MEDQKKQLLEELAQLEAEFRKRGEVIAALGTQLALARADAERFRQQANSLEAEKQKLMQMNDKFQQIVQDGLRHSKYNAELQARLAEFEEANQKLVETATRDKLNYETQLRQLQTAHEAVVRAKQSELDGAAAARKVAEAALHAIIEEKTREIEAIKQAYQALRERKEANDNEARRELEAKLKALEERNHELLLLRKADADTVQKYEVQLQQMRVKYEEQILQLTNKMSSGSDATAEMYRRKLMTQKTDYEKELVQLKKRIAELEKRPGSAEAQQHAPSPRGSIHPPPPPPSPSARKVPLTFARSSAQ